MSCLQSQIIISQPTTRSKAVRVVNVIKGCRNGYAYVTEKDSPAITLIGIGWKAGFPEFLSKPLRHFTTQPSSDGSILGRFRKPRAIFQLKSAKTGRKVRLLRQWEFPLGGRLLLGVTGPKARGDVFGFGFNDRPWVNGRPVLSLVIGQTGIVYTTKLLRWRHVRRYSYVFDLETGELLRQPDGELHLAKLES
jgi:hypothetical protein